MQPEMRSPRWLAALCAIAAAGLLAGAAPGAAAMGACCIPGQQCRDDLTPAICAAVGGTFMGEGTACVSTSCPGPCCIPDDTCHEGFTRADCLAAGGTFAIVASCAEAYCPGACCFGPEVCQDNVTSPACAAAGGAFRGANTTCAGVGCEGSPLGACCIPGGDCAVVTVFACAKVHGVFGGGGSTCEDTCPAACCFTDGMCIDLLPMVCVDSGGSSVGGGLTCAELGVCTATGCAGDINGDARTNVADLSVLITHFGAAVPPGTSGDLNGDGVANTADLGVLIDDFGCGG